MKCPQCNSDDIKVIDSRTGRDGASIRRRRECNACGARFTTLEAIIRDGVVVIKRDGSTEDFNQKKLMDSLRKVLEKRPVEAERLPVLVGEIMRSLDREFDAEIPSRAIAERAMEGLRQVDSVAYVRYASAYLKFVPAPG
jgi:transcriptional repressor NrdR